MHDPPVVLTSFTGRQQGVQVDLTPLGTTRLLSRPAAPELTDRIALLAELDVPALARLPIDWPTPRAGPPASLSSTPPCARCSTPSPAWSPTPRCATPGPA